MKTHYLKVLGLVLCLSASFSSLHAQVKIGNNPQTINAASLLELESSDKAFVIPRMNTVQMNSIVPLEGAIIYNTEAQCLHYFDGLVWINICEAFGNSITFSSESLENPGNFETITITQTTPTNFNFEVGILNASNIQDGSIISPKITDGAVTLNKLATNSVDNSKILNRTIQAGKLAPGLPNQVLQTNVTGTAALWSNLNANSISGDNLTAGDGSILVTNGVGATLLNTNIRVNINDATFEVDPINGLQVKEDGITIAQLGTNAGDENKILGTDIAGNPEWQDAAQIASSLGEDVTSTNGSITGVATDAALVAMNLEVKVDDVSLEVNPDTTTGLQIKDAGVTTDKIDAAAVDNSKLADDAVTLTKIGTAVGDENKILGTDTAGDPEWQDAAQIALSLGEDVSSTNGSITGVATDAALVAMNLEVKVDDVSLEVNPDTTTGLQIKDAGVTTDKIDAAAVDNSKLADDAVTITKIGTALGDENKILGTNIAGDPEWQDAAQIAVSLGEDVSSTNGSITGVAADAALVAMNLEVKVDDVSLEVNPDSTTGLQIKDAGVTTAKIDAAAVDNSKLANDAVQTENILDATIVEADLADDAVTTNKISDDAVTPLKIDATLAGTGLLRDVITGILSINPATVTGDGDITSTDITVTGGTDAAFNDVTLAIADDAITNLKIADDAISPLKIDATLAGTGLSRNAITGILSVNGAGVSGDGNITSTDLDVTGDTNALLGDVSLEISNVAVTAAKVNANVAGEGLEKDGTTGALDVLVDNSTIEINLTNGLQVVPDGITSAQIANNAVSPLKIDATLAGTGLSRDGTTGILSVNPATVTGDGDINSTDITITGGTDAAFNDVTLAIADDAITNLKIADDAVSPLKIDATLAGTGLSRDIITGVLSVNDATVAPIFSNITGVPADLADGDDDTTYAPGTGLSLTGTTFAVDNTTIAPVFSNITSIPSGLADGDDDTTYSPGTGLSLTGTTFAVDNTTITPIFSNITGVPAGLADGDDDTTYTPGTGLSLTGTTFAVDNTTIAPVFSNITGVPAGLADGDDDTTYAPGTGLSLTGTTFAVDNTTIAPIFSNITGVPVGLADGDDDTTYAPGDAMTLVGTVFSIADGDITTNKIANGTIVDADVSSSAAILGTKINPNFGNLPVSTTNTISSGNNTITGTLSTTGTATIGANTITNINGSNGQVLTTDGAGNATWISLPTDANTTYSAGTGLTLTGTTFSVTPSATNGQVLTTVAGNTVWASPVVIIEVADEFLSTLNQTIFTLNQTPSANSKVKMYVNGLRVSNTDYSLSGTTITYNGPNLNTSDRVQFDYYY
ncbi:hypothetical protein [Cellulophaga sp. Hel_I_12]|uniref:beta strand repeat-containing protein n=1 Tax=Cellulophaga sp. Hel_I_12 TaxID=1249972 RepID=UPI0006468716|nr:hypothetical protein [Cellulophaga sp. Hel_I_12]